MERGNHHVPIFVVLDVSKLKKTDTDEDTRRDDS